MSSSLCLQVYVLMSSYVLMSMSLCYHFLSYSHGTLSYVSMSPSQVVRLCPQVLSYMSMSLCHEFLSYSHSTLNYVSMSPSQVMCLSLKLCVYVPMSSFSSYSHSALSYVSMSPSQVMCTCPQVKLCVHVS